MRITSVCLLLMSSLIAPVLHAATVDARHVTVELLAEDEAVVPDQPLWVLLQFTPEEGWHTYWKNPGDSGLAPKLDWRLPAGWQAGQVRFPTPEAIPYGSQMNYGYHGPNGLLVELVPPARINGDSVDLHLKARWLVCADACVPGQGEFHLPLPVKQEREADAMHTALFARTRAMLPVALSSEGNFTVTDEQIQLELPAEGLPDGALQVFIAPGQIAEPKVKANITRTDKRLQIQLQRHTYFSGAPDNIEVVLTQSGRGWAMPARSASTP